MTPTAEAIYAMTDAEYRAWQSERTIRHQRRTESPSKRAIRRAATRAGYIVTAMHWAPVGWRAVDEWDDPEIREVAEQHDGRTLDGGWEVWLVDADGNEELVQQYQLDLTIEAIERLAEAATMTTSETRVRRAIETLRERHREAGDGACNWDESGWPCDTATVLDALDVAIARAEAAERVVEAARTFRHASRHGQMIGDVFDAIDVFREVVREHDAATAASESEATP